MRTGFSVLVGLTCAVIHLSAAMAAQTPADAAPAGAPPKGYHLVAEDNCGTESQTHVVVGTSWLYPVDMVDASAEHRAIVFDNHACVFWYLKPNPEASYKIDVVYVDNGRRIQRLEVNGHEVHGRMELPVRRPRRFLFDVPKAAYASGEKLQLKFIREAGANAIVSYVRIWSTDPARLAGPSPQQRAAYHPPRPPAAKQRAPLWATDDPIYLPDGRIAFMSPVAGGMVQCGDWAWADCLFSVKPDGSDLRQITRAKEGEWDPTLMDDGTILFTRWEYVMRFWRPTQLIWNVRPDGTYPRVVSGYLTGERNYARCRQIPGTGRVVCVEAHHHNDGSGNILIIDLKHGRDTADGERTLVSGACDCPYPIDENYFLISYDPTGTGTTDRRTAGRVGIYLADYRKFAVDPEIRDGDGSDAE